MLIHYLVVQHHPLCYQKGLLNLFLSLSCLHPYSKKIKITAIRTCKCKLTMKVLRHYVVLTNLRETIRGSKSFGVVGLDPRTYSTILTPKPPVSLQ